MTCYPASKTAQILAVLSREPGSGVTRISEVTGYARDTIRRALYRFEQAGHVSSDEIDGVLLFWLERPTEATAQTRVMQRLAKGPATWAEIQAIAGHAGTGAIVKSLEAAGLMRVEERTRTGYNGRTVTAPSLYHAVKAP